MIKSYDYLVKYLLICISTICLLIGFTGCESTTDLTDDPEFTRIVKKCFILKKDCYLEPANIRTPYAYDLRVLYEETPLNIVDPATNSLQKSNFLFKKHWFDVYNNLILIKKGTRIHVDVILKIDKLVVERIDILGGVELENYKNATVEFSDLFSIYFDTPDIKKDLLEPCSASS